MAANKAIRSNSSTQPHSQPTKKRRRPNHQFKAQLFDVFHQLNRGYGLALGAFDRLEQRGRIFPRASLRNLSQGTQELRALANHNLLTTLTGAKDRKPRDSVVIARGRKSILQKPAAKLNRRFPSEHKML